MDPSRPEFAGVNDPPQCDPWRAERDTWLQKPPDAVVVLSGVWETYDRVVGRQVLQFGTPAFDRWFSANFDALHEQVTNHGAKMVLLTSPCFRRDMGVNDVDLPENDDQRIDDLNDLSRAAAARHADTTGLIGLHDFLCPHDQFLERRDGVELRQSDGVHMTADGARVTLDWLVPRIEAFLDS